MKLSIRLSWIQWLAATAVLFLAVSIGIYVRGTMLVPHITCESPIVDLGVIRSDEPIECLFTIRNSGHALLRILGMKSSCACTVVPFYQSELKHGESTVVPVRLDVKNRRGSMKQYVLLTTNDPAHRDLPLRLTGDVEIGKPTDVIEARRP